MTNDIWRACMIVLLATTVSSAQQQPAKAADGACALVTQAEAAAVMGVPARAPRVGAFAPNTCAIQSEGSPATLYVNTGLDTAATLSAQGMPNARQVFDGVRSGVDDAEALTGVGDAAFFSTKINGLYIVKGGALAYVLVSPELMKTPAAVAALKKLAATVASRM